MFTSDKNIVQLIDWLIFKKIVPSAAAFCREIDLPPQSLTKIKNGKQHFTPRHIELICKKYKINANWIFGIEKNRGLSAINATNTPPNDVNIAVNAK